MGDVQRRIRTESVLYMLFFGGIEPRMKNSGQWPRVGILYIR